MIINSHHQERKKNSDIAERTARVVEAADDQDGKEDIDMVAARHSVKMKPSQGEAASIAEKTRARLDGLATTPMRTSRASCP